MAMKSTIPSQEKIKCVVFFAVQIRRKYSIVKSSVNTTEIDDMIEEYENWYKPQNNNGKENVPHLIIN